MFSRFFARLQFVTKSQRRTISEYAKSFGYKPRKSEVPEPTINPLKIVLCYGGAIFLINDVIQDRKQHYKTFIEQYQEGREYLKVQPYFNQFTPLTYPPVDRFLENRVPEYDIKEPNLSSMVKDGAAQMALKEDPNEWKKDMTSYTK